MKISEVINLNELNYPGNIGMMEMFRFFQIATDEMKQIMKNLLAQGKTDEAWELLQKVTGMKLQK